MSSPVQIIMNFPTAADAAAFLAGRGGAGNASPTPAPKPAATTASSSPTAAAAPADAPAPKAEPSAKPLDFDKDVFEAMRAYSKKVNRDVFVAFLKNLGVEKPADLKAKPDQWQKAIDAMQTA